MKLHFIAIGGSAMHALAVALHDKGFQITGSDDAIYDPAKSVLKRHGLLPEEFGWYTEKISKELDAVILGMHAKTNNPELLKAEELGLKIYSYPEFLFEQVKDKTRVVIAGSHGKTTITAMILHVMKYHGKEIDFFLGAPIKGVDNLVKLSAENDFVLIEGDEYFSSAVDRRPKFLFYLPNIALLSGIAWDHYNVFAAYEEYVVQFEKFVDSVVNGGILVYNEEDKEVRRIAEETFNPIRKHGYSTPQYHLENGKLFLATPEGPMPLEIFGRHNMSNLAGAKWICQHMGIDEDDFFEAISEFKGASGRLEKVAEYENVLVFKDFAHSPSKVKASTNAVREQYPEKRLVACFELHTYSSLNSDFIKMYKNKLDEAEQVFIYFSPEAIEKKGLPPLSAEQVVAAFDHPRLQVFTGPLEFRAAVEEQVVDNTVLLLMSSGTFSGLDLEKIGVRA